METIAHEFSLFNKMDKLRNRMAPTYQVFPLNGG